MDDSFYGHLTRMDWGFGNPNKTAALIASIMLAVWIFAYMRKWGFWLAVALFTGFGVCIILTLSRGCVVGFMAGGICVLAWTPRPFSYPRICAVIAACVALIIFAFIINAGSRYTQALWGKDRSVGNRLLIWSQVPSMIHDAPNGWGLGQSGDAYMQWYQPITRGEGYRTLVNSHLTWLTELNWWGRAAYVFAWVAIFIVLWPAQNQRWFSIPLGIWIAFGVCAIFSSTAEAPLLWVIPIVALASVLIARMKRKMWPEYRLWLSGTFIFILIIVGIFICGMLAAAHSPIFCLRDGVVTLGSKPPKIWIIAPNRNVLGEHYGHEIRQEFDANPIYQQAGLGITSEFISIPPHQILILSGQISPSFATLLPSQLILIDPQPVATNVLNILSATHNTTVIVGEYSRNKDFWDEQSHFNPNIKLQVVMGSEEYIPDWMHEIAPVVKMYK